VSSLDLRIKRTLRAVPIGEWDTWTSEAKVIADTIRTSGLQDKSIAIEIGVDPAVLSKVQSGQARLSEDKMDALMDACGSEAWLHYWLHKRGYDPRTMRRLETELERDLRLAREEVVQLRHDKRVLVEALRGGGAE
jgi:hypothetical protein